MSYRKFKKVRVIGLDDKQGIGDVMETPIHDDAHLERILAMGYEEDKPKSKPVKKKEKPAEKPAVERAEEE